MSTLKSSHSYRISCEKKGEIGNSEEHGLFEVFLNLWKNNGLKGYVGTLVENKW